MCSTALSSLRGVREEQHQRSSPLFRKKEPVSPAGWSQRFVCLHRTDAEQVPCKSSERLMLEEAGLREKVLVVNMNFTPEEFRQLLLDAFPKLAGGGGFELLRCKPKSKELILISCRVSSSPKLVKKRVGNGKVYVRPIQRELSLDAISDDDEEEGVSVCATGGC